MKDLANKISNEEDCVGIASLSDDYLLYKKSQLDYPVGMIFFI
jgi:hypothetical protein